MTMSALLCRNQPVLSQERQFQDIQLIRFNLMFRCPHVTNSPSSFGIGWQHAARSAVSKDAMSQGHFKRVSLARRIVCDFVVASRHAPLVPIERRMKLAPLVMERNRHSSR